MLGFRALDSPLAKDTSDLRSFWKSEMPYALKTGGLYKYTQTP